MTEFLAQVAPANVDWIAPLAVQGGVGALALFMLRWFMGKNDANQKTTSDSLDRLRQENAASNERLSRDVTAAMDRMGRELAASNDRMGRAHLMLVLALDGVNEAAKARAKNQLSELEESLLKAKEKDPRP